jgi:hypothetical protein
MRIRLIIQNGDGEEDEDEVSHVLQKKRAEYEEASRYLPQQQF